MHLGVRHIGQCWLELAYGSQDGFSTPISILSNACDEISGDPVGVLSHAWDTYFAVANVDLTGKLYELKKIGFWKKVKDYAIPGTRRTIRVFQGVDAPGYSFTVAWNTDRAAAMAFLKVMQDIDNDGSKFYPRDNLWYHKIHWADAAPDPLDQTLFWQHDNKVYLVDPYLYSEICQLWAVPTGILPQTSATMWNFGHLNDGFETISITGTYDGTHHVEDLVLSVAGGNSMTLSDRLLSGEKVTLGVNGDLITEWTADLTSLATFQQDATTSGVTFSGDHIAIAAGGYAIIILSGPWPTKKAVKMTAHLTIAGSTASVQVYNGTVYVDAVANSSIKSGQSAVYNLTGSAKRDQIYIKINSPAGSTVLIHSLKIERELDCSGADLSVVAAGESAAFTVSCDVSKSTLATIAATYRPRRYAV